MKGLTSPTTTYGTKLCEKMLKFKQSYLLQYWSKQEILTICTSSCNSINCFKTRTKANLLWHQVYLTNLRPTERGQTGPMGLRGKKTRMYLEQGKQNQMCVFVNMWMTFIGPLMMYNNFSVTVYGALDHVYIFSDFRLVNVY